MKAGSGGTAVAKKRGLWENAAVRETRYGPCRRSWVCDFLAEPCTHSSSSVAGSHSAPVDRWRPPGDHRESESPSIKSSFSPEEPLKWDLRQCQWFPAHARRWLKVIEVEGDVARKVGDQDGCWSWQMFRLLSVTSFLWWKNTTITQVIRWVPLTCVFPETSVMNTGHKDDVERTFLPQMQGSQKVVISLDP